MLVRLRTYIFLMLSLLFVAGMPGSVVRPVIYELAASPMPEGIVDRDGVLDVFVTGPDGKPREGARVRAFAMLDGRAHAAGSVDTDRDGRASLKALPRAEHWIVAEAPGFARASQMVVVVPGARRVDLALVPEHFLEVEVKTEQGALIENAEIEARGADPFPIGAKTDDKGRVKIGRLGEGPFVVTVRATGYEQVVKRRVPEGPLFSVVLGKQGGLLVKVVGETGEPVPNARVMIASPSLWPARVAETGPEGTVRIGGLDPGIYAMRSVQGTRVSPIELGVQVGREEKSIELRLEPGVTISAHVIDAASEDDVNKARVTLAEGGLSPFPLEGLTDKRGRVILGPIARGTASLAVSADGYVPKSAVRVEDPIPPEITISLLHGGTLVGKITDLRGYAVDGATIKVIGTDLEGLPIDEDPGRVSFQTAHFTAALGGPTPLVPAGELGVMPGPVPPIPHGTGASFGSPGAASSSDPWITGRDGTYKATPVSPGRVRILVRHPQYVEVMSEVVQLASDKEATLDVVLARGGALEGRVFDAKHNPVGGAHVTVLATRGSLERMTRTGTDGSFAFASVPEALTILVARDDDPTQIVARTETSVPEGGKRSIEVTIPDLRDPLHVTVTADRVAIDAAQITATSIDPNEAIRVTAFTDRRGEADLKGARGVALRVEVRAPGHATKIVMTTPDTKSLEIALPASESLTGEIWANRRETVEGADVVLQTETGARHARSNKDGAFSFGDLTPGPAKLRIRAKGRAPVAKDVMIEDRAGRRATELGKLDMGEEAIVEGVVLDQKGDPVPGARVAKDAVPTYLPVGVTPQGMAVCDAKGRFKLGELADGNVSLEAYAPDAGRAKVNNLRVIGGRTLDGVKIVLNRADGQASEPLATGGVAVTLGETVAGLEEAEVVIVAVAQGSEAERAGLAPNDTILEVGGKRPKSIADARTRLSGPVHDDVVVKLKRNDRVFSLRVPREAVRR